MASPKTSWPTVTELTAILTDMGVEDVPSGITLEARIEGAVEAWHGLVNYSPFLAGTADDYDYSPCASRTVYFDGYFANITAVTVDGVAQTVNEDYVVLRRGPSDPIYGIEFSRIQIGDPWTINVTGQKGWSTNIPYDAWIAVCDLAAADELERNASTSEGDVKKLVMDGDSIEYAIDASPQSQMYFKLREKAAVTSRKYKLIGVN